MCPKNRGLCLQSVSLRGGEEESVDVALSPQPTLPNLIVGLIQHRCVLRQVGPTLITTSSKYDHILTLIVMQWYWFWGCAFFSQAVSWNRLLGCVWFPMDGDVRDHVTRWPFRTIPQQHNGLLAGAAPRPDRGLPPSSLWVTSDLPTHPYTLLSLRVGSSPERERGSTDRRRDNFYFRPSAYHHLGGKTLDVCIHYECLVQIFVS